METVVAPLTFHDRVTDPPGATNDVVLAENLDITGRLGWFTVTVTVAVLEPAALIAVRV